MMHTLESCSQIKYIKFRSDLRIELMLLICTKIKKIKNKKIGLGQKMKFHIFGGPKYNDLHWPATQIKSV